MAKRLKATIAYNNAAQDPSFLDLFVRGRGYVFKEVNDLLFLGLHSDKRMPIRFIFVCPQNPERAEQSYIDKLKCSAERYPEIKFMIRASEEDERSLRRRLGENSNIVYWRDNNRFKRFLGISQEE